jgi:hypothetical protein
VSFRVISCERQLVHAFVERSNFDELFLPFRPQGAEFRVEPCRLRFCRGQLVLERADVQTSVGEFYFELTLTSQRSGEVVIAG